MLEGIAVAQINVQVGDIDGNVARIRAARAKAANCALLVCPEMAVCGYPPEDLILRPAFRTAARKAVEALAAETTTGPALLVGSVWEMDGHIYNAALLLAEGQIAHVQPKRMLPNYGIFDEKRVFTPGAESQPANFGAQKIGILVCEDSWHPHIAKELVKKGAQMLIVINASPFENGKLAHRHTLIADTAQAHRMPVLYANLVGGQDDIVFDGGSFAVDATGKMTAQAPQFSEYVGTLQPRAQSLSHEEEIWNALTLGLRDYVHKNNFSSVLLGLSGGIDSAVVAALATDALGHEHVLGVLLPSHYTSKESMEDAHALAKSLRLRTTTLPITPTFEAQAHTLAPALADLAPQFQDWKTHLLVGGNLQARIRGTLLSALSNATGHMLLSTGNKSEVATGYTTLYGDSCGGYAPIKDVYKTDVYALAKWRNARSNVIPLRSISKAPSAELAPGQKDEDQLPPYALLDAILKRYIEGGESVAQLSHAFDAALVARVAGLVRISEYKRRQMPPGAKISSMIFNRDWRYPLTNGFKG